MTRITVNVSPNNVGFADVSFGTAEARSQLDVEISALRKRWQLTSSPAQDLFFFSALVYAVDKQIPRSSAPDRWTRTIELSVPVADKAIWVPTEKMWSDLLRFLSGDDWRIRFTQRRGRLVSPSSAASAGGVKALFEDFSAVSLFSGGLDSLIGVINWLESEPEKRLALVGHYDRHIKGPYGDQEKLAEILRRHYPERLELVHYRVGQLPVGKEITFRSRSFVFIGSGLYLASLLGEDVPLLIPENGQIALNLPLTAARRGSCSTRTAHPYYLSELNQILGQLGIKNTVTNPLSNWTKGECAVHCKNQDVLRECAPYSVSCAKRGHTRTWIKKEARGCGKCIPCIYRRAALLQVHLDDEPYGIDISLGQLSTSYVGASADDLRALLSYVRRYRTPDDIMSLLTDVGGVQGHARESAELMSRATKEVRTWFLEKGTADIRGELRRR